MYNTKARFGRKIQEKLIVIFFSKVNIMSIFLHNLYRLFYTGYYEIHAREIRSSG